ncbi:MAG: DUF4386 domain-containing protein [Anaerolineae bacterium]
MSNELETKTDPGQPLVYQIRIKGHLGSQWTDWFEGLSITLQDSGDTLLTGPVIDQAALHGLLKRVRDLGMPLLSVSPVQPDPADAPEVRSASMKRPPEFEKGEKMNSIQKTARMAGFLYVLFLITGIFAGVVRSNLIVYGDAGVTVKQIMAAPWLFRIDFISDLLSGALFLLSAWALYVLLKPVNKNLALLFVLLNLGGVAVQCVSLLNQFAALLLLSGADYLKAFPADQLQVLAMLFLNLHRNGFMIAQLFFGAWLLPLGYLVYRSGFLPGILGVLLIVDFFGVLIWFFQFFLLPGYEVITYPGLAASFVAEVSLSLWLLIKGVKDQQPVLAS